MAELVRPVDWPTFSGERRCKWLLRIEWLAQWTLYAFRRFALLQLTVNGLVAVSVVVGIALFALEYGDRKTDRAVRRATMLATIVQVSALEGTEDYQNPVVPILEIFARERMDLSGLPLPNINLTEVNLSGAHLKDATFSNAVLNRAVFESADLRGANFKKAHLSRAKLNGANLREAGFNKAILQFAHLRGANLYEAFMQECHLVQTDLTDANLELAQLVMANLSGATLSGVKFRRANLGGADLSYADLRDADFSEAAMNDVDLKGVKNLTQRQLDSACLYSGELPRNLPEGMKPPSQECKGWGLLK